MITRKTGIRPKEKPDKKELPPPSFTYIPLPEIREFMFARKQIGLTYKAQLDQAMLAQMKAA